MIKRIIPLSIYFLIAIITRSQTIIVVLHGTIYVGADSKAAQPKMQMFNGIKIKDTLFLSETCKLRRRGSITYTAAGWMMDSLLKYTNKSLSTLPQFGDSIHFLQKTCIASLEKSIEEVRLSDVDVYLQFYNQTQFAKILFLWYDHNSPKISILHFITTNTINERVKIKVSQELRFVDRPQSVFTIPFNISDKMTTNFYDKNYWIKNGVVPGIKDLIESGSEHDSTNKITILEISPSGTKCILNGACDCQSLR